MFVTNWISTTKIQKISEITNFFRHYFLSRTEVAKTLYDGISDSKWHLFVGARHMPFAEQNDEYCEVLEEWLGEKD